MTSNRHFGSLGSQRTHRGAGEGGADAGKCELVPGVFLFFLGQLQSHGSGIENVSLGEEGRGRQWGWSVANVRKCL